MTELMNAQPFSTVSINSGPSGLVRIPMKFNEEKGAVVAGILGYKFHESEDNSKNPSIEAMHGWSVLLEPDSKYRQDLTSWEEKINGV